MTTSGSVMEHASAKGRRDRTARRLALCCPTLALARHADRLDDDALDAVLVEPAPRTADQMRRALDEAFETVGLCKALETALPAEERDPHAFIRSRTTLAGVRAALKSRIDARTGTDASRNPLAGVAARIWKARS